MTPYFSTPSRQAALAAAAADWFGTPFHPHAAVKGAGVDCVWLAARLYIECGLFRDFNPPAYTMDGGAHNELSPILHWLDHSAHFERVEQDVHASVPDRALSQRAARLLQSSCRTTETVSPHTHHESRITSPGDLLCFRIGKSVHHVGVVVSQLTFVHVIRGYTVMESRIDDATWSKRLVSIYRPVEVKHSTFNHQPSTIS